MRRVMTRPALRIMVVLMRGRAPGRAGMIVPRRMMLGVPRAVHTAPGLCVLALAAGMRVVRMLPLWAIQPGLAESRAIASVGPVLPVPRLCVTGQVMAPVAGAMAGPVLVVQHHDLTAGPVEAAEMMGR